MTTAFISYTHSDEGLKDRFLQHLAPLRREGLIDVWHDRMLRAGDHLEEEIQRELASSDLIILLISAAFIHSEYCYEEEMQRAFLRQRRGEARVIAVILRSCQWKHVPVGEGQSLSSFLAVPKDGKAITSWQVLDEAFDDAAGAIRSVLMGASADRTSPSESADPECKAVQPTDQMTGKADKPPVMPVLPRLITDRDRNHFLKQTLEASAAVFEARLKMLSDQNDQIETEFERLDTRSFIATVYSRGDKVGECRIFLGDSTFFNNSLCLSFDASSRNAMNEWLVLDTSANELIFKPAMASYGASRGVALDEAGAADHFWRTFVAHVQTRLR
ncbi:MAG TPA: toll/interleukin-1 receptor domain-containing protein [Allosphingosinicella sp.]|nr:toll/interleukin-1 receptor domain-containing protein [Allosphingosinicella sp.]